MQSSLLTTPWQLEAPILPVDHPPAKVQGDIQHRMANPTDQREIRSAKDANFPATPPMEDAVARTPNATGQHEQKSKLKIHRVPTQHLNEQIAKKCSMTVRRGASTDQSSH